jgi:hypothetical protein
MRQIATSAGLAMLGVLLVGALPSEAAPAQRNGAGATAATDFSAQTRTRRARPQVRITPRYPYRTFHSFYPLPYPYEYPGPNGVRKCVDWYVTEYRPSGTVLTPRMRCWWVQG